MSTLSYIAATFTYIGAVAFIALLWVSANTDTMRRAERHTEHAGSSQWHRDIICGQGYENLEDCAVMTKRIELIPGTLYVHLSGIVVKCLRMTADGCAVLMDINKGELLTVCGCREYPDGKIEWAKCLEVVATC